MAIFWIIFWQEILIYRRNLGRILASFLFFIISISIFSLISQNQENQDFQRNYLLIIIWFSLLSSLIFSTSEFCKKDFEDGSLEQILIACENFEIFILAKILANWLTYVFPLLLSSLAILAFSGFEKNFIKEFLIIFLLASFAINFICSFCGSLSTLGNAAPMVAIIALPLTIPTLLIAHSGLIYNFSASCKILSGLCVLTGAIAIFAAGKIVKIAAE